MMTHMREIIHATVWLAAMIVSGLVLVVVVRSAMGLINTLLGNG